MQIKKDTLLVGLTGPIGAGKTLVGSLVAEQGYPVLDADQVARDVVQKGRQCLVDLVLEFGIEILNGDGTLNRRKLGNMVFRDKERRKKLNVITFPYIQEELFAQVARLNHQGNRTVFLDAPTLIESGTHKRCDRVVTVIAPREDRMIRVLRRDDLTEDEIDSRMKSQHEDDFYISRSDFVIRNSGDLADLKLSVMEMLEAVGATHPIPGQDA